MPFSCTSSQNNELFWEGSLCFKSLVICDSRFESQIAIAVKSRDLEHLVSEWKPTLSYSRNCTHNLCNTQKIKTGKCGKYGWMVSFEWLYPKSCSCKWWNFQNACVRLCPLVRVTAHLSWPRSSILSDNMPHSSRPPTHISWCLCFVVVLILSPFMLTDSLKEFDTVMPPVNRRVTIWIVIINRALLNFATWLLPIPEGHAEGSVLTPLPGHRLARVGSWPPSPTVLLELSKQSLPLCPEHPSPDSDEPKREPPPFNPTPDPNTIGGHLKPVTIKPIFRIFRVLVSAFSAFLFCGISSDPYLLGWEGTSAFSALSLYRVRIADFENPTDRL